MVAVVSVISIVAYILSLIRFSNKWVEQQIVFLLIYLIGLTAIGELDVLLPIYFVVTLLPFLKYIRRISAFTAIIAVYFGAYLIYGLINQNPTGTLVTFVAKMWQFIVFFIVYDAEIYVEEENYKGIINVAVIFETLLGLYLMATSTNMDVNGLVRLVSNSQPITGNISTVILPIVAYFYFEKRRENGQTRWLLFMSLIMLAWIVLSGTRGYTLEFAATMFLIIYDYFVNGDVSAASRKNRLIILVLLGMGFFVCAIAVPEIYEKLESVLRVKASVGIRTFENAATKEFFRNTSLFTEFLGVGLGGQGGKNPAMREALYRQFSLGMWDRQHYLYDCGALFHNLYANVLMCMGAIGMIMVVFINIEIWKRVSYSCSGRKLIGTVMHLFQLSFLLMNYYRWSAVCGIAEMILFALILKRLENDNEILCED